MPRYYVKYGNNQPVEVTREGFIEAERQAGFRSYSPGLPATAGFTGYVGGGVMRGERIEGWIEYAD